MANKLKRIVLDSIIMKDICTRDWNDYALPVLPREKELAISRVSHSANHQHQSRFSKGESEFEEKPKHY